MTAADQYKQKAAECLDLAHATHDQNREALLLTMAQAWMRLADFSEQVDSVLESSDNNGAEVSADSAEFYNSKEPD